MGQAEVTPTDALGDPGASAREGQRADTVGTENDVGIRFSEMHVSLKNISVRVQAAGDVAIREDLQCRNLNLDLELFRQKFADRCSNFSSAFQNDEAAGLRNAKVYDLPRGRVRGILIFASAIE